MPEAAEPGLTDDRIPDLMALVRQRLYVPDGLPPAAGADARDEDILRCQLRHVATDEIVSAIEGLALRRDRGDLQDWIAPHAKCTLRALVKADHGGDVLFWHQCVGAWHKAAETRSRDRDRASGNGRSPTLAADVMASIGVPTAGAA